MYAITKKRGRGSWLSSAFATVTRATPGTLGYADDAVFRHGILDPGVAYLQKPITPDAFMTKVRKVLGG